MGQAVVADPLRQCLRQPIIHASLDVAVHERVKRSNQMVHGHTGSRFLKNVSIELLALELRAQVVCQVMTHEFWSIGLIAVQAMRLAERVVDGSIKGARCNQHAKLRNRLSQMKLFGGVSGGLEVCGFERAIKIDRVAKLTVSGGNL